MSDNYTCDERCRQIVTLLAYPKVGPLTAPAICVNLDAGEAEVREALQMLAIEGTVITAGEVCLPALHDGMPGQTMETLYAVPRGRSD